EARLDQTTAAFKALGPESIFARGFTATTNAEGNLITSKKEAPTGTVITTRFAEDSIDSTVN
ncbi:MAG: exonuclease VII large subunit, partial [Pseudoalteromonas tetraodonis]